MKEKNYTIIRIVSIMLFVTCFGLIIAGIVSFVITNRRFDSYERVKAELIWEKVDSGRGYSYVSSQYKFTVDGEERECCVTTRHAASHYKGQVFEAYLDRANPYRIIPEKHNRLGPGFFSCSLTVLILAIGAWLECKLSSNKPKSGRVFAYIIGATIFSLGIDCASQALESDTSMVFYLVVGLGIGAATMYYVLSEMRKKYGEADEYEEYDDESF